MKRIVLFALVAALCAGALLYMYLNKLEQQKQAPVIYEDVVVAASDIPAFTQIGAEMVQVRQVPAGTSHPQAARALDEVVGYVTEGELLAGEEVLPAKLKQPGQTESGLSYIIPEGMRAFTISVDEISGVARFIQRGDYVDVLAFISVTVVRTSDPTATPTPNGTETETGPAEAQTEPTETTENATVVVAQNICVAAVGTTLASSAGGAEGEYGSVTLFVTPEDAMRINQCEKAGVLTLVLRASGDHEQNTEDPILSGSLLEKAK